MQTEKRTPTKTPTPPVEAEEKQTASNPMDIFRDYFTFKVGDRVLKGRIMTLEDVLELQEQFPEWTSDDPLDIIGVDDENPTREKSQLRIRFIQALLNRFIGQENNLDQSHINRLFNYRNMPLLTDVVQKIMGYEPPEPDSGNDQKGDVPTTS